MIKNIPNVLLLTCSSHHASVTVLGSWLDDPFKVWSSNQKPSTFLCSMRAYFWWWC